MDKEMIQVLNKTIKYYAKDNKAIKEENMRLREALEGVVLITEAEYISQDVQLTHIKRDTKQALKTDNK